MRVVWWWWLLVGFPWAALPSQQASGTAPAPNPASKPGRLAVVEFDAHGFPLVADEPIPPRPVAPPAVPAGETRPTQPATADPAVGAAVPASSPPRAAQLDGASPLVEVFTATGSPGAWKRLGGLLVTWKITIYDAQGAVLGTREVLHTADSNFAARDRLEFQGEGRVYGRLGPSVFAERQGRPWPTWIETAGQELALFGLHLRLPWAFGDPSAYAVTPGGVVDRPDERLQRLMIERRPPLGMETFGPEVEPAPRDRFELCYEPSSGRLREFVQRFAWPGSGARTVLFDEWEEFRGVLLPRRRIYVDDQRRPTTMLQIVAIESAVVTERDFRLH